MSASSWFTIGKTLIISLLMLHILSPLLMIKRTSNKLLHLSVWKYILAYILASCFLFTGLLKRFVQNTTLNIFWVKFPSPRVYCVQPTLDGLIVIIFNIYSLILVGIFCKSLSYLFQLITMVCMVSMVWCYNT